MITVRVSTPEEKKMAESWPIWEKEISSFPWEYLDKETCYVIEGKVKVSYAGGEVEFGAGDWVVFQKGLKCTWTIIEDVKKNYKFG